MIFGRSTIQIMALVTATIQFIKQVTPVMLPGLDPAAVGVVLDALSGVLAVYIAVLANTSTTPVNDPQLKAGTMVRVTDAEGVVVAHSPIEVPEPPKPEAE